MLAARRLSADPALRTRLGAAAHAWWRAHGTLSQAAAAWTRMLADAASRPAPIPQAADGTARARETLDEFGVSVDIF
jgi:hypothetical protein